MGKTEGKSDLRSAYQAVLGELDSAKNEIGKLRTELQMKDGQLWQMEQDKRSKEKDVQDMENRLNTVLERLSAIEKRIGIARTEKRKALNISGWTIQQDGRGFYRGFRNIGGRVHGVYLGKSITDDPDSIKQKLISAFQKIAGSAEKKPESSVHADRRGSPP